MPNNCKSPEMCLLSETCIPCAICPNANEKADDRLALTACSPLGIAVSGYLKNRLSLVESLGNVSFVYGQNGHDKSKRITDEIARIDVIVAGLVSPENVQAVAPATLDSDNPNDVMAG